MVMERVAKFRIIDSFKITGRGLVAYGDLLEGRVKVGNYLPFNTGSQDVMLQIAGVDMMDKRSTGEYWVGLTFVYRNEKQRADYEVLKLKEQIVDILDGGDWRLLGQEDYLFGATLFYRNYSDRKTSTDHDHCEFCGTKFSDTIPDTLRKGYTISDDYRWICDNCFADFKDDFRWTIGEAPK
jgi:hypothetical protein